MQDFTKESNASFCKLQNRALHIFELLEYMETDAATLSQDLTYLKKTQEIFQVVLYAIGLKFKDQRKPFTYEFPSMGDCEAITERAFLLLRNNQEIPTVDALNEEFGYYHDQIERLVQTHLLPTKPEDKKQYQRMKEFLKKFSD